MGVPDNQLGITIAFAVLILVNIIGNILVCLVIITNRTLKTSMYYFLVNLACADICVAVFQAGRFILFFYIEHGDDFKTKMLCTFITGGTLSWVGGLASAYSLVAIAIERYYAILYPHHSRNRLSLWKIKGIMTAVWVFAIIFIIPGFLSRKYNKKRHFCAEDWPNATIAKVHGFAWLFVGGIIPSSVMIFLYSRVVYGLWFAPAAKEDSSAQVAQRRARKKLTEIVLVVTAIYIVCWMPVMVIYTLAQFGPTYVGSTAQRVGIVLMTVNSTVNPVLYTFHSKQFRKHLFNLLLCRRCGRNKRQVHPITSGKDGRTASRNHNTSEVAVISGPSISLAWEDDQQAPEQQKYEDLFDESV